MNPKKELLWSLRVCTMHPKLWRSTNMSAFKTRIGLRGYYGIIIIWEFPKIRGTLFWGPYNKDPTI